MKKLIAIMMTIVIAFSWGCNDEPIYDKVPDYGTGEYDFSITATIGLEDELKEGYSDTKVAFEQYNLNIKVTWVEGDEIHLSFLQDGVAYEGSATAKNLTNGDRSAEFAFSLPNGMIATEPFDLYGVYGGKGLKEDDASIALLPDNSNHGELASLNNDMMLYFESLGVDLDNNPSINVSFKHIGSMFNLTLTNTGTETLTSLKTIGLVTASETETYKWAYNVDGKGTFNLTNGEFEDTDNAGERIVFNAGGQNVAAGASIRVWAWFPILPDTEWPDINVDIEYSTNSSETSSNIRPKRVPETGNAYYMLAEWDGKDLTFVETEVKDIYFVKTDGDDNNDGRSWDTAFKTITKAIDESVSGSEIRVAKGEYKEGKQIAPESTKELVFKGGYNPATNEQDYSEAGKSIINANNEHRVLRILSSTSFDNFIFANGYGLHTGTATSNGSGAGLYHSNAKNTIISNCIFRNNSGGTTGLGEGGAIVNAENGVITLVNCLFEGNSSNIGGGGIANWNGCTATIINCTFVNNAAKEVGGAIYNRRTSASVGELNLYNSILWNNTANKGNEVSSNRSTSVNGVFNFRNNIIMGGVANIDRGSGSTLNYLNSEAVDVVDANPRFTSGSDFRPSAGSPAIDAGDNSVVPAFIMTDLGGSSRFKGRVDLGAYEAQNGSAGPDDSKAKDIAELLAKLGATKYISNCDFDALNKFNPYINTDDPFSESIGTTLEMNIDTKTKYQGEGSYRLDYKFTGKNLRGGQQRVVLRKRFYDDYRSDLSFHPLGISLWVRSFKGNTNSITIRLLQQNEAFTLPAADLEGFTYTDSTFLDQDGWNQMIIPYEWFRAEEGNVMKTLNLRRVDGMHVELTNPSLQAEEGTVYVDAIQQLTSFVPDIKGPSTFTSIFVQLHDPTHKDYDWTSLFNEYLEVGVDTLIVQRSVNYPSDIATFWYTGSSLPWKEKEYNYLNEVFAAAESTGMKIVLGMNQGRYPDNRGNTAAYDQLYETNKVLIDDLYDKFAESPSMAGWYICEEFHDGAWMGWLSAQNSAILSNYLNRVATYAKSKEKKFIVTIAPSLWRGRPADMTYTFYKRILENTPAVDIMYLQDNGGRCFVDEDDYDVYIPQYFEMIKKACDEAGVQFGVDIESFEHCPDEGVNWARRNWTNLKQQLDMAGMYTKNISQFSWTTFRPGIGAFDEYKEYLRGHGLLKSQKK